ncbi:hypothetical protein ACLOJK_026552 [Asimina triloba]
MATSAPQGIPQESTHKPWDDDYEEEKIVLRRQEVSSLTMTSKRLKHSSKINFEKRRNKSDNNKGKAYHPQKLKIYVLISVEELTSEPFAVSYTPRPKRDVLEWYLSLDCRLIKTWDQFQDISFRIPMSISHSYFEPETKQKHGTITPWPYQGCAGRRIGGNKKRGKRESLDT